MDLCLIGKDNIHHPPSSLASDFCFVSIFFKEINKAKNAFNSIDFYKPTFLFIIWFPLVNFNRKPKHISLFTVIKRQLLFYMLPFGREACRQ